MSLEQNEYENIYNELLKFYDFAEDIVDALERERSRNPEWEVEIVAPVIEQIQDSADIIAETYIEFVNEGGNPKPKHIKKIETAIRKIFTAIMHFTEQIKKIPAVLAEASKKLDEYMEEKKRRVISFLEYLVEKPELLYVGPHGKEERELILSHPQHAELIWSVHMVANFTELVSRAFCNPKIGLIQNLYQVEPGMSQVNMGLSTDKQHNFGHMVRQHNPEQMHLIH